MDKVPAAGTKEFKRPPETSAGTARDYSTTFRVACKDCRHVKFVLSVITQRAQNKEEFESSSRRPGAVQSREGFRAEPNRDKAAGLRMTSRLRAQAKKRRS